MNERNKNLVKVAPGKLGKLAGALNTVLGIIPDTVEIVGKITDKTAPIVEKNLDRQHEYKKSLIPLPNLLDVDVQTAKEHLESIGLTVIAVLAKPDKKYAKADVNEVVAMVPKSGKVEPGTLVKLYYVDRTVLEKSQEELVLPNVVGFSMSEAQAAITEAGFYPVPVLVHPQKKYAQVPLHQVLSMSPMPSLLTKIPKKGSMIKLYYADAAIKEASSQLVEQAQLKKMQDGLQVKRSLEKIHDLLPKKK